MRRASGQATVEWSAIGLLLALLFATAAFTVARTDAWSFGEGIVHSIVPDNMTTAIIRSSPIDPVPVTSPIDVFSL